MPPVINPRGVGSSWGTRLAIMAGRVLPPGGIERTRLMWMRCESSPRCGDDDCQEAGKCLGTGPMLGCAKCWREHTAADVVIVGPLAAPTGVECRTCGGRDLEVDGFDEPTEDKRVPGRIYYSPETKQLEVWAMTSWYCTCGHRNGSGDTECSGPGGCGKKRLR